MLVPEEIGAGRKADANILLTAGDEGMEPRIQPVHAGLVGDHDVGGGSKAGGDEAGKHSSH